MVVVGGPLVCWGGAGGREPLGRVGNIREQLEVMCGCCELGTDQLAVLVGDIGVHVLDHKSCMGAYDMEK